MHPLHALAEHHRVAVAYHDQEGRRWPASDADLVAVLAALGVPIAHPDHAEDALRAARWSWATDILEPVQVVWSDRTPQAAFRLHRGAAFGGFRLRVGADLEVSGRLEHTPVTGETEVDGQPFLHLRVDLPRHPEVGYHPVDLTFNGLEARGWLVSAPAQTPEARRGWGLFAPTYALRSRDDWGVGTLRHLERLNRMAQDRGASWVGTLPLLATFLDRPFDPSPYSPVSRRFWNELYLDLDALPEVQVDGPPRQALRDLRARAAKEAWQDRTHVDHRAIYPAVRAVLEACAEKCHTSPNLRDGLERWADSFPSVDAYARFRAHTERSNAVWHQWYGGRLPDDTADSTPNGRLHRYAQFRLFEQMHALRAQTKGNGAGLYLDLPLGVHPDGFDAWADRDCFVPGFSVGAPPDNLAPEGQDWGFRPFHPQRIREARYGPWISSIRHHCEVAKMLRIDHVMGLHRLFWVPFERGATAGTYVRLHEDELWATLSVEAARTGCALVGEDLGTVPPEVRERMGRHGVRRMYVAQFELRPDGNQPLRPIPDGAVVSLNTHDTPTFEGFWQHRDIADRRARGILDPASAAREDDKRAHLLHCLIERLRREGRLGGDSSVEVFSALWLRLAEGPGTVNLVNLEDLWLEPEPQNVPGTQDAERNWCRRTRLSLEQVEDSPELRQFFDALSGPC
jgi:4-alpha-glucanotransferase